MFNLFGSNVPSLEGLNVLPNMDMGQLGTAGPITDLTANYTMPQKPNYGGLMAAMGMLNQQQPQAMPQQVAPPQMQIGGESFQPFYQFQPHQPQSTAQRLSGLLGGLYGTV